jgi:RNA polymerase sigma-70 factor (ECF subfamily)
MPTDTEQLIPTRETLLSRLRLLDDHTSWREFFETYWRLIYNVARKSGFTDAGAQDIVQETFVTVSRHMPEFRYDPTVGSFKGWLLQITRSRIIDALRKKHAKRGDEYVRREETLSTSLLESHPAEAGVTLDAIWDDEWHTHLLDTALERVKQHADARQFQMFYLHVLKSVPALQVARRLGAKLPEVYFAKYKISARLKKEIKRLEKDPP